MRKRLLSRVAALALVVCLVIAMAVPAMASTTDVRGNEIIVITIDPGHGATTDGTAATYNGVTYDERDLNLKIARYCKEYLEENYWNVEVLMTRENKGNPSLKNRVAFAAEHQSDFLLSIHLNGLNGNSRGALACVPLGIYNPEQGKISRDVATAILKELEGLGVKNRGFQETLMNSRYPDGTRKDAYEIVRHGVQMDVPAIIMEQCFLDNQNDFQSFLSSEEKLKALGEANARALAQYFGLKDMSTKPQDPSSAENGDTPFEDVFEEQWFYNDVTYTYENDLIRGMTETTFVPAGSTTRAMVVALLYRIEGTQEKAETVTFTDVKPDSWYYNEVEWAYAHGVTKGVEEDLFCPEQNVTREQFVTFLYRYAEKLGYPVESEQDLSAFSDVDNVSEYALSAMRWAVENGMIQGYDDGTILPGKGLSRAELAALMHRFDQYLMQEEPTDPEETEPTDPEETEPTDPEETEPTDPEVTEPTDPEVTEPTDPEGTTPTEPEDESTEPSEPDDSEPVSPEA